MPHKVTYCRGIDGSEKFEYVTKGPCDKTVPWNNTTRIIKKPAEDVFTGMNEAVAAGGDLLFIRIVPDNRTKPPTHCKALYIMPGDSRECEKLKFEYAEAVRAKLPVNVEPFAIAQIELVLGPNGQPDITSAADYELYEMALKAQRKSVEFAMGRKIEKNYPIFQVEEVREAVNALEVPADARFKKSA